MTEQPYRPKKGDVVALRATVGDVKYNGFGVEVLFEGYPEINDLQCHPGAHEVNNLHLDINQLDDFSPDHSRLAPWHSAEELAAMEKVIEAVLQFREARGHVPSEIKSKLLIFSQRAMDNALAALDAIRSKK